MGTNVSYSPSSSSSSVSPVPLRRRRYDVFLSFRRPDTRGEFIDPLYISLKKSGINDVFLDEKDLRKGEEIDPELVDAIQNSTIAIVVLSKRYAESGACMMELEHIMKARKEINQIVYPVFYKLEPKEVRDPRGKFQKPLNRRTRAKAEEWKQVLKDASHLKGWATHNVPNWPLGTTTEKIVDEIFNELRRIPPTPDRNLIGIEARLEDVKTLIKPELDDVLMIGILGIAGSGKTSIARALFNDNDIMNKFKGWSFVENVGALSVDEVQTKILSDILPNRNTEIRGELQGRELMQRRLKEIRVLIVLDGIHNAGQLEAIAGNGSCFSKGSRIIITTSNKHLLKAFKVNSRYTVKLLTEVEAKQLLSRYAFKSERPSNGYDDISLRVVEYASGLPFAVKTLGLYLCGRSISEWKGALKRFRKYLHEDIHEKLKKCYNVLQPFKQQAFLHIACFFRGWEKDDVTRILASCELHLEDDLESLEEESLIDVVDNRIQMHSLLQEMGKYTVREEDLDDPGHRSRLWCTDEIWDVLMENTVTNKIKAIVTSNLDNVESGKLNLDNVESEKLTSAFSKMKKLELFLAGASGNALQGTNSLPTKLRWLNWHYYPSHDLPRATKVVGVELLHSNIVNLFCEWSLQGLNQGLNKLKYINLSFSKELISIPKFKDIPNLETLILEGCGKLTKIDGIHEKLVLLNLRGCKNLASFTPPNIQMNSLEILNLSGCSSLKGPAGESCTLPSLKEFFCKGCPVVVEQKLHEHKGGFRMLYELEYSSIASN